MEAFEEGANRLRRDRIFVRRDKLSPKRTVDHVAATVRLIQKQ